MACDQIVAEPHGALPEFLAELDVVGYNYVGRWRDRREKFYSIDRHDFPQRRFIGTENGAMPSFIPGSSASASEFRSPSNQRIEVEQLQRFTQVYDYVCGDFMWTGVDYLGEARWPAKASRSGVIDTCGFAKDGFYFYKSLWTKTPVLHLSPHWNWAGSEGQIIPVICFTNCDTVELFLNGKSLGVQGYMFPEMGMEGRYSNFPARTRVHADHRRPSSHMVRALPARHAARRRHQGRQGRDDRGAEHNRRSGGHSPIRRPGADRYAMGRSLPCHGRDRG